MRTRAVQSLVGLTFATFAFSQAVKAAIVQAPVSPEALASDVEMFVEPVETPVEVVEQLQLQYREGSSLDGEISLDQIINIGKEIWAVIEKNKPVVDVKYDYATALPQGVRDASLLDGFSDLTYQSYRMYGKNAFGAHVYDVIYTLVHQHGGSYDGKGAYLATVTVLPSKVDVLWGYNVDLNVKHVSTLNVGSRAAPVGSIAMELSFTVSTVLKRHTSTTLHQFRGDSAEVRSTGL